MTDEKSTYHVGSLAWYANETVPFGNDLQAALAYANERSWDDDPYGVWEQSPNDPDDWELVAIVYQQETFRK